MDILLKRTDNKPIIHERNIHNSEIMVIYQGITKINLIQKTLILMSYFEWSSKVFENGHVYFLKMLISPELKLFRSSF